MVDISLVKNIETYLINASFLRNNVFHAEFFLGYILLHESVIYFFRVPDTKYFRIGRPRDRRDSVLSSSNNSSHGHINSHFYSPYLNMQNHSWHTNFIQTGGGPDLAAPW